MWTDGAKVNGAIATHDEMSICPLYYYEGANSRRLYFQKERWLPVLTATAIGGFFYLCWHATNTIRGEKNPPKGGPLPRDMRRGIMMINFLGTTAKAGFPFPIGFLHLDSKFLFCFGVLGDRVNFPPN
ncbi:hypothetical protein CEXT_619101 [Caerostris extrusa]|uniref:Uncharacterized protein n=1 Tax=Caerostris extrusa TaxID=172846 RepID=A0AAV4XPR1_CAEEX|nr:hypothetical protein CEXT_619101 [Caerostris extrusa]